MFKALTSQKYLGAGRSLGKVRGLTPFGGWGGGPTLGNLIAHNIILYHKAIIRSTLLLCCVYIINILCVHLSAHRNNAWNLSTISPSITKTGSKGFSSLTATIPMLCSSTSVAVWSGEVV